MRVTEKQVTKLLLSEMEDFDNIGIFVEDLGPKVGRITIESFGDCWSHIWGGIPEGYTTAEFFVRCNDGYLLGKFGDRDGMDAIDADKWQADIREAANEALMNEHGNGWEIRDALAEIEDLNVHHDMNPNDVHMMPESEQDALRLIMGEEWYSAVPTVASNKANELDCPPGDQA